MAHLEEFTSYKQTLMESICMSKEITDLLRLESDPPDIVGRDMRFNRIFPYNYVPLTIEQAKTFVCFTVVAPQVKNNVITQMRLIVWVFTHQNLMRTSNGMRTDLLVSEIDKLLNGSTKYGFGKVERKSCDLMNVPCEGYTGLVSVYSVDDFNRSCVSR